jgi:hypothetical protein
MKKFFTWLFSGIGVGGITTELLKSWIKNSSISESPNTLVATLIAAVVWTTGQIWFYWVLGGSIIGAGTFWALYLLALFKKKRKQALEQIGGEMLRAAEAIRARQGGFRNQWPGNIADLKGKFSALCAKIRSYRILAPTDDDFNRPDTLEIIIEYFDMVGSHLRFGNKRVAKVKAREIKDRLRS